MPHGPTDAPEPAGIRGRAGWRDLVPAWAWAIAAAAAVVPFVVTQGSEEFRPSNAALWTSVAAAANGLIVLVIAVFLRLARRHRRLRGWFVLAALMPFVPPAAMTASDLHAVWRYQNFLDQLDRRPVEPRAPSRAIVLLRAGSLVWQSEIFADLLADGYDPVIIAEPTGRFSSHRRAECTAQAFPSIARPDDVCYTRSVTDPGTPVPAVERWLVLDGSRYARGADRRSYSLTVHPVNAFFQVEQGRYDRFRPYITVPLPLIAWQAPSRYQTRTYVGPAIYDPWPLFGWWRVAPFEAGSAGTAIAFVHKMLPRQ